MLRSTILTKLAQSASNSALLPSLHTEGRARQRIATAFMPRCQSPHRSMLAGRDFRATLRELEPQLDHVLVRAAVPP